jgi:hypothetical protein
MPTTSVSERLLIASKYVAIAIVIAVMGLFFGGIGFAVGDVINPRAESHYVSFAMGVILGFVFVIGVVQLIREADKRGLS